MKIGVVGLPNVGKSTLFNALTRAGAASANYPFCTIEPNVGIVTVPDARVEWLSDLYKTKSTILATIEFADIAGLVRGASKGEGLGNKFLGAIRECDAILHVVRAFDGGDIIHVEGTVNPTRDIDTINLELILADLDSVVKQIDKLDKQLKGSRDAKLIEQRELLGRIKVCLEDEKSASCALTTPKEREVARGFFLLTTKPVIYLANLPESDMPNSGATNAHFQAIAKLAASQGNGIVAVCAKIEEELSQVADDAERTELMQMYGITNSGLDRLIAESYKLLGLISFITAGEKEVRAWTIPAGTKAPQAAGAIHTDFERGFIRAEIVSFKDFQTCGTLVTAKERGLLRSEGKEYTMQDGDVVHFRFNV